MFLCPGCSGCHLCKGSCHLSCRFVEALRAAVRHTSKSMGVYISSKMGGGSNSTAGGSQQQREAGSEQSDKIVMRPFPYVVPIVAKSGQLLFDETGRCTKVRTGQQHQPIRGSY